MNLIRSSFKGLIFPVMVFMISSFTFSIIFVQGYPTDLGAHINILKKHLEIGGFPVPPLYYFSLYLMKLLLATNFLVNSVFILSICVVSKFLIAQKYILVQTKGIIRPNLAASMLVFGLIFFFPIYLPGIDGSRLYLGKFTPSIWHNSTTIFAFVFSLLLFIKSIDYIEHPNYKKLVSLFLLGSLVLLSKPSFMFVFIPCFPLVYALEKKRIDFHFLMATLLCGLFLCGVFILKWMVYSKGEIDQILYEGGDASVWMAPFEVWLLWTDKPIFDLISSFLFLFLFMVFYFKQLMKDWHFQYAMMLGIAGLIIFWTFAETGERFAHGNFYWQVPICLFIVYLVLIKHWFQMVEVKSTALDTIKALSKPNLVLLLVFSLHVISGGIYLFNLLYFGSYT